VGRRSGVKRSEKLQVFPCIQRIGWWRCIDSKEEAQSEVVSSSRDLGVGTGLEFEKTGLDCV
jgi:predicted NUDIX family NTP pyrophosphohydrolase